MSDNDSPTWIRHLPRLEPADIELLRYIAKIEEHGPPHYAEMERAKLIESSQCGSYVLTERGRAVVRFFKPKQRLAIISACGQAVKGWARSAQDEMNEAFVAMFKAEKDHSVDVASAVAAALNRINDYLDTIAEIADEMCAVKGSGLLHEEVKQP